MQKLLLVISTLLLSIVAQAQFTRLPSGIEYRIVKKGTGKKTAKPTDQIAVVLRGKASGTTIFDTKTINKGGDGPVYFPVAKKQYNGDVMEVLMLLHEGDSVTMRIPQDSFYRMPPANRPKFLKPGDPVIYNAKCYFIKTKAEFAQEQANYKKQLAAQEKQQREFKKQMEAQQKAQKLAATLVKKDDKTIVDYLKNNGISNYEKTAGGTYVVIDQPGTGDYVQKGFDATMNYTGTLLDGTKFDSNVDSAFNHVQPFKFKFGQGQVIKGWDEGLAKFNKGAKGRLFIPSGMAYGANAQAKIPANSILKFDVELVDFVDPAAKAREEDETIQKFLKDNNITDAIKTPSGLYYQIISKGDGALPKTGDKINMNYTGMFLNGQKFDSNTDSAFNHVSPFKFDLGRRGVIAGWDEGIALMNKGTKAKLIIPSALGYGANGNGSIPANSILQFDVEVVDIEAAAPTLPPAPIQTTQPKK